MTSFYTVLNDLALLAAAELRNIKWWVIAGCVGIAIVLLGQLWTIQTVRSMRKTLRSFRR